MNEVKSVKIAVIISQAISMLWLLLTVMAYLFQRQIQLLYEGQYFNTEKFEYVFVFAHIPQLLAFAVGMTADYLMLNKKRSFRLAPIIITSVTAALLPLLNRFCLNGQSVLTAHLDGAYKLVSLNYFCEVTETLTYLLFAGLIIALAASAVYAYSKRDFRKQQ